MTEALYLITVSEGNRHERWHRDNCYIHLATNYVETGRLAFNVVARCVRLKAKYVPLHATKALGGQEI
jgi:hypothetical protein